MTQAKAGDAVKVHYTGKLADGDIFSTSTQGDPLQFIVGQGETIPGFEQAVEGMQVGDSKRIEISPEQAYGPYLDDLVIQVDCKELPPDLDPKVGDRLQIQQEDGRAIPVNVIELSDEVVTLDANHPLAGKDLKFEIELVEIL